MMDHGIRERRCVGHGLWLRKYWGQCTFSGCIPALQAKVLRRHKKCQISRFNTAYTALLPPPPVHLTLFTSPPSAPYLYPITPTTLFPRSIKAAARGVQRDGKILHDAFTEPLRPPIVSSHSHTEQQRALSPHRLCDHDEVCLRAAPTAVLAKLAWQYSIQQ
ncbi:hypothetical protein BDV96DRAFT_193696 [Lophiotrema nucula]|uniref:Uncharacterized protein n=1 Tax=Lophiotrema nucula TaxID=690887 RepID=A0A6A5YUU5_9PLEO|nr:hypothetical protein BDV96DRAFT_193696 [Lophiotrema nucula]